MDSERIVYCMQGNHILLEIYTGKYALPKVSLYLTHLSQYHEKFVVYYD